MKIIKKVNKKKSQNEKLKINAQEPAAKGSNIHTKLFLQT